ncbi:HAL/PAL/TAL family ammonia-lyase [Granulosicoccus antarcticus]|uniref:tyrosine ammonia-lyase n=1 Tax=Granulosicoccus antarcticus IMCC3135 TaxID=1192854 RepID=A0A2Z2NXR1_9GAMM|nr:aromatic amino acid ammonia-lyase [Granulosicoccus antarcticus]ASJ76053.1 Histidine ammonia-lyase [Granulosicoccus antarcticus IMCC3135]
MLVFDDSALVIEDVVDVAYQRKESCLSGAPDFVKKINKGAEFLDDLLKEEGVIYGVTTGYGDSCTTHIPMDLVSELPKHLYTFHGCGLGAEFSAPIGRAVLAVRLVSLAKGFSGVSYGLLEQLMLLLRQDIIPIIPEEGSVGASGDLTPLSYVAAVLCGEREVYYQGQRRETKGVFRELKIEPVHLRPKEGLALMNGTAVMTALACVAYERTSYLAQLATRITSLMTVAIHGNAHHFDELLFSVKPHPGQQKIAAWLREDLHAGEPTRNPDRLQDRYSLRCAPHVIGVVADSFPWWRQFIENELNSANDNPIIDGEGGHVLHGGHFYGGHIAYVMDSMKNTVANVADLLDRQMAQLVDPKFNNGLPANLSGAPKDRAAINHGFKAVQIGMSAWTAEALKLTMPASVFSRSTECHNQDKVSMGTIAARDCLRILQLTEQVAAAALLAACQGVELRAQAGDGEYALTGGMQETLSQVREEFAFLKEDRALEKELRKMIDQIQSQHWQLFE